MAKIDGDRQLGEQALAWLHDSGFGWHVYKRVPVWQLQVNLGGKTGDEIRALASDVYDLALPAGIDKQAAIAKLVEHFRAGPRLSEKFRQRFSAPVHKSSIRFDGEQLRADFERLRARLRPEEKHCPGCEDARQCTLGDDCGRLEYGWTLQSFGEDHSQAVFGGPHNVLESLAVVKTEACFGIFEEIVDSIPGACRARLKVYRPNYRFGHLPHTDACDIIGMLCRRPAAEGGVSGYCSALAIYNEIAANHPDVRFQFFLISSPSDAAPDHVLVEG
jgi:hypothetical protein